MEKDAMNLTSKNIDVKKGALKRISSPITMAEAMFEMHLTAFLDYKDFLVFMETEYEKLGRPTEYAEVMELFRAIDSEINEEHLPRSMTSDELDKLRETIRKERAQRKLAVP